METRSSERPRASRAVGAARVIRRWKHLSPSEPEPCTSKPNSPPWCATCKRRANGKIAAGGEMCRVKRGQSFRHGALRAGVPRLDAPTDRGQGNVGQGNSIPFFPSPFRCHLFLCPFIPLPLPLPSSGLAGRRSEKMFGSHSGLRRNARFISRTAPGTRAVSVVLTAG